MASGNRQLWTGPYGVGLRDRLLATRPWDRWSLWIAPTPQARDQAIQILTEHHHICVEPRVWCWSDVWHKFAETQRDAPRLLSEASSRAIFEQALNNVRTRNQFKALARVWDLPGFRRHLRARIAGWTSWEPSLDKGPPGIEHPTAIDFEEWEVFQEYRGLLHRYQIEDNAGFEVWASRAIASGSMSDWFDLDSLHIWDLTRVNKAVRRTLEFFRQNVRKIRVTVPYDESPLLSEPYTATVGVRDLLVNWEFEEQSETWDWDRPNGLQFVERDLFRDEEKSAFLRRELAWDSSGLSIDGGPRGEGVGMLAARKVRDWLDQGVSPHEIVILVRRWDEHAIAAVEMMKSWDLPIVDQRPRSLASLPAASVVRLMARVPANHWESEDLIALLRNGQLQPKSTHAPSESDRAISASAIQQSRVFRGLGSLRRVLARMARIDRDLPESPDAINAYRRAKRSEVAQKTLDWFAPILESLNQPATWHVHVNRLFEAAEKLGVGRASSVTQDVYGDQECLEHLRNILEDYGLGRAYLGQSETSWTLSEFVEQLESLTRAALVIPTSAMSRNRDVIQVMTVDESEGTAFDHVLVLNLDEGLFPTPESVDPRLSEAAEAELDEPYYSVFADPLDPGPAACMIWSREQLRFMRLAGMARQSLTLLHSVADQEGQRLLPAGFLEDLKAAFEPHLFPEPPAWLDPVDPDSLAGSANDLRVQAMAQAVRGNPQRLLTLAGSDMKHWKIFQNVANAFEMARSRFHAKPFGVFEGMLRQAKIRQELAKNFGAQRRVLSPTQLESFILCPFQFFVRFVLGLVPIDERDELDRDKSEHGRVIHDILEQLHERLAILNQQGATESDPKSVLRDEIEKTIDDVLKKRFGEPASMIEMTREEIEAKHYFKLGERYGAQYELYRQGPGKDAQPFEFEVEFGRKPLELAKGFERLVIGQGDRETALQGIIDRVDLIRDQNGWKYRVIDYKSGHSPTKNQVMNGDQIQLPLYALAIEDMDLLHRSGSFQDPVAFGDFGYWDVKNRGFRAITVANWPEFRHELEEYLLTTADRIRDADFPVFSRDDHCTAYCEYKSVCRVAQVRRQNKAWEGAPRFQPPSEEKTDKKTGSAKNG